MDPETMFAWGLVKTKVVLRIAKSEAGYDVFRLIAMNRQQ